MHAGTLLYVCVRMYDTCFPVTLNHDLKHYHLFSE